MVQNSIIETMRSEIPKTHIHYSKREGETEYNIKVWPSLVREYNDVNPFDTVLFKLKACRAGAARPGALHGRAAESCQTF
jgi:hypothetical protein